MMVTSNFVDENDKNEACSFYRGCQKLRKSVDYVITRLTLTQI